MSARVFKTLAATAGALVLSVLAVGCSGSGKSGSGYGTTTTSKSAVSSPAAIAVIDYGFKPANAAYKVGAKVTWKNTGQIPHTVKGPGFQSRQIDPGQSFSFTFRKAGTFKYICTLHPSLMKGRLKIS